MYVPKIAKILCPKVFAPTFLDELPPSWSGVFARIWSNRTVHDPAGATYQVTVMSRDEAARLRTRDFQEMIKKYRFLKSVQIYHKK